MKKCNSCNIEFITSERYCPLCQNILVGHAEESTFPKNIRYKTNSTILKIVLFSSIVVFLVSGFIELMITKKLSVSIYIGLGLITNFIIMYFILKNYQNTYRMIGRYGLIIILLLAIWYFKTKSPIITNYIIPSICILELTFNFIISIIIRKNYLVRYSSQIVLNLFLLILTILMVVFKLTTFNLLTYIYWLLSTISIVGILIFFNDEIKDEFRKNFNI